MHGGLLTLTELQARASLLRLIVGFVPLCLIQFTDNYMHIGLELPETRD